jgi:hypothetical protein
MLLKTSRYLILLIFLFNFSTASAANELDEKSTTIVTLDRILNFSYDLFSKKTKHFKEDVTPYQIWLKSCPKAEAEKFCKCYENLFFKIFSNQEYFHLLTKAAFKGENLKGVNVLSDEDRMWLITLFIKHYSMTHGIKNIDPYDIINYSFYEYFKSYPAMRLYQRNHNDFIFLWDEGGGSHNKSYIILSIHLENDDFSVNFFQIPILYSEGKIEMRHSINSSGSSYDATNDLLIINASGGDVTGWVGTQAIYKIHGDALTLIKQRSTTKYEVICPDDNSCYNVGINAGNPNDWKDEYVQ